MANVKVALLRYCRLDVGWRRLAVTPARKGRGWDEEIKVPVGQKILESGETDDIFQRFRADGRSAPRLRRILAKAIYALRQEAPAP